MITIILFVFRIFRNFFFLALNVFLNPPFLFGFCFDSLSSNWMILCCRHCVTFHSIPFHSTVVHTLSWINYMNTWIKHKSYHSHIDNSTIAPTHKMNTECKLQTQRNTIPEYSPSETKNDANPTTASLPLVCNKQQCTHARTQNRSTHKFVVYGFL